MNFPITNCPTAVDTRAFLCAREVTRRPSQAEASRVQRTLAPESRSVKPPPLSHDPCEAQRSKEAQSPVPVFGPN